MAKISISIKEGTIAKQEDSPIIIGIDLGTTNSLIAFAENNIPKVVKKDGSSALVPSIIHFGEDGNILVGNNAKDKLISDPSRTIYSVKRLMGKSYTDLEQIQQYLAYEIQETNEEELIKLKIDGKYYTPIALSANILAELKTRVEEELKTTISKAVITVPAYFNDAQRQATRDAGKIAGLDVLRIVNEPTAASLAYGLGLNTDEEKKIAVYDLGGGTFDISILNLQHGVFEVLSTNGDTFLGGDDFDRSIVDHWISKLGLTSEQLENDKSFTQELRLKAEEAKKHLSKQETFNATIGEYSLSLDKATFESLIKPLIEKTLASCKLAVKDAEIELAEIDEVLLVGGSTRTPLVKSEVGKFFGKPANDSLNPDEVVALGAAIQADILAGNQKDILLLDVTPLSLGIETMGGLMDVIIPRNNKIPTKASRQYTTSVDGQSKIMITVFQGERDLVEHNRKLGAFILEGIPGMPAGLPKVEVSFLLDADGILVVRAKELRSETETSLRIESQYGISEEEMAKMLLDSISNAKEDMTQRSILEARNEGNGMVNTVHKFLQDNKSYLTEEQYQQINEMNVALQSLIKGEDKDAILDQIKNINDFTEPLANEALGRIIKNQLSDS